MPYLFDRRALFLPLAIPALATAAFLLLAAYAQAPWAEPLLAGLIWVIMAGIIYILPYLLILGFAYPRIEGWPRRTVWRITWSLGLLVAVAPVIIAFLSQLVAGDVNFTELTWGATIAAGFAVFHISLVLVVGELAGRHRLRVSI